MATNELWIVEMKPRTIQKIKFVQFLYVYTK